MIDKEIMRKIAEALKIEWQTSLDITDKLNEYGIGFSYTNPPLVMAIEKIIVEPFKDNKDIVNAIYKYIYYDPKLDGDEPISTFDELWEIIEKEQQNGVN